MILTKRYDFVERRVIKLDLIEVNEHKYSYFTHTKTPHQLFCPKIEKKSNLSILPISYRFNKISANKKK